MRRGKSSGWRFGTFIAVSALAFLPALVHAEEPAEAEATSSLAVDGSSSGDPKGVVCRLGQGVWVQSGTGKPRLLGLEKVEAGQTLRTGPGSGLEIRFYGDGVLALLERTQVTLEDPSNLGVVSTILLHKGIVFLSHDPRFGPKEVEIRTRTANVRLKAARIAIAADRGPADTMSVTVLEGKGMAEVASPDGEPIPLHAGERIFLKKGSKPSRPWKVDPGLIRQALELWKPGAPILAGEVTDAILLLVDPR